MLDVIPSRILFDGINPIRHVLIKRIEGYSSMTYSILPPQTDHFSVEPIGRDKSLIMYEATESCSLTVHFSPTFSEPESVQDFIVLQSKDFEFKIHLIAFADGFHDEDSLTQEKMATLGPPDYYFRFASEHEKSQASKRAVKVSNSGRGIFSMISAKEEPSTTTGLDAPWNEPKWEEVKKKSPKADPVVPKESPKKVAKNPRKESPPKKAESPKKGAKKPPKESLPKEAKKAESPKKGAKKPPKESLPKEASKEPPKKSAKRSRKDSFPKEVSKSENNSEPTEKPFKVAEPTSTQKSTLKNPPIRKGKKNQPPFQPEVWEDLPELGEHLIPDALHPKSSNGKPLLDWQYQANWDNLIAKFP